MKIVNDKLEERGDKYWELVPLYNSWNDKTKFLSTGNTNVPEWDAMLEYCKENKKETAHFFLDLIEAHKQAFIEGLFGSDFVGFFNNIISEVFKDEGIPIFTGFVGGSIVQETYQAFIEDWLNPNKDKNSIMTLIEKYRIISEKI